jgi:hypothetical protein
MKKITGYIRRYFYDINKAILLIVSCLTALMIFFNYYFRIDHWIGQHDFLLRFIYRYMVSLVALTIPYVLLSTSGRKKYLSNPVFIFLLLTAPAIFSLKMALILHVNISSDRHWDHYWNQVLYWPLRLIIVTVFLFILWKKQYTDHSFFGLTTRDFEWRPYAWMLLIMVPLIATASTQHDFLTMYPKLKMVTADVNNAAHSWFYKLLFELSYGSDFVSIELFFRGFLILGFVKWVGKDAILPMACFYCTIHFGKPLGECISSYFGGLLLGIVVYHTRSIFGGLMVHLGIAWLMEAGGYIHPLYP